MTKVHAVLLGWFLSSLYFSSAQVERLPIYPEQQYSDAVKFDGIPGAIKVGNQTYQRLVFSDDYSMLYGGKDVLHAIDATTANITSTLELDTACTSDECGLTVIEQLDENCLFVCIAKFTPECYFVDTSSENLRENSSSFDVDGGDAVPTDSSQNNSWMYVKEDSRLFTSVAGVPSAAAATFRLSNLTGCSDRATGDPVTADAAETWLSEAQFVGDPFLYNGYIYFFYRELSMEDFNAAGDIVYSRIARVCQDDPGGPEFTQLAGDFLSFKKARLDCSLSEIFQSHEVKFEYNEIQGTYLVNKTIFAVFTTQRSGVAGSALCAYSLDEIEELFDKGEQRGQPENGKLWKPLEDKAGLDELYNCNDPVNTTLTTNQERILQEYPLMDKPVPNKLDYKDETTNDYTRLSDAPLFVVDYVRFSQIVVDPDVNNTDVMFLGSENGMVYMAYLNETDIPILVEAVEVNTNESPIRRMLKSPDGTGGNRTFIGTDDGLYRLPLQRCLNKTCRDCENDPYCVYDGANCVEWTEGATPVPCDSSAFKINVHKPDPSDANWVPLGKPSNLNFAADAKKGAELRAEEKVDCSCSSPPLSKFVRIVCNESEHVMVNVVIQNVTKSCTCTVTFSTIGDKQSATANVTLDETYYVKDKECLDEVADYDQKISNYTYELNKWKNDQISNSSFSDVAYCKEEC